jgi:CHAP domain
MTAWNDSPPRGHPMEGSDDFPGPLYPPSHPKDSKDSDFVIAVKRAAAHLGAWPWDPPAWDDAYSEKFAMEAIKPIQKWSGTIDPTGNCGTKTYNFLRSVLIQQGRTHAGEPAWDSVCINLTAAAYENQHQPPPSTMPTRTAREAALERAILELGTHETGNNDNKYGAWYGENYVPWCAIFCTWAYETASDSDHPTFQSVKQAGSNDRYDYVPYIVADARNARYGLSVTSSPLPGDLVCYDWNWNGEYDHVGLFEAWDEPGAEKGIFSAIEGNTSPSNNSNGGEVMRRSRNRNAQGTVFVRVMEP